MTMGEEFADWLGQLESGDDEAAQAIWQGYYEKLVRLARQYLTGMPRRAEDVEEPALIAFNSFSNGASAGRFPQLFDRDDLWKILMTITVHKATAHQRRHFAEERGGGGVPEESVFIRHDEDDSRRAGIGQVLGAAPTPKLAADVAETFGQLLDGLGDERLKRVSLLKMEGYTNDEMAGKLHCSVRTVQRIRRKWSVENTADEGRVPSKDLEPKISRAQA